MPGVIPGAAGDGLWDSAPDAMEPLRISIELDPGAEPVAGTVTVAGEAPRAFVGWMELVNAIERARRLGGS
jgi:hypothetical protein